MITIMGDRSLRGTSLTVVKIHIFIFNKDFINEHSKNHRHSKKSNQIYIYINKSGSMRH